LFIKCTVVKNDNELIYFYFQTHKYLLDWAGIIKNSAPVIGNNIQKQKPDVVYEDGEMEMEIMN